MNGYDALHDSAAWLDLSDRGKIRVTGRDRARFLHNLLSNDVKGLAPGQGNYHFLLNAQGRIQADANLFVFADWMLLDCDSELTERILQHLKRYIIADQVALEDVTSAFAMIAVEGPKAQEAPRREETAMQASITGQPGIWFLVDPAQKARLIADLERAGAVAASPSEAAVVRVENARPRYAEDFGDTTLPQETRQDRAISFTKGCYLGQEIVERIRSRGQVHKQLVLIGIDGSEPPAPGSTITAAGQEIGHLTSPVYSPRMQQSLGLAILRREFATPEAGLQVAGRAVRIIPG